MLRWLYVRRVSTDMAARVCGEAERRLQRIQEGSYLPSSNVLYSETTKPPPINRTEDAVQISLISPHKQFPVIARRMRDVSQIQTDAQTAFSTTPKTSSLLRVV